MLTQNTSQAFMSLSLAVLLSLCSLSAFSEGSNFLDIRHSRGNDQSTYSVKSVELQCVKNDSPDEFEVTPGGGVSNYTTITIEYYKTINFCDTKSSYVLYEVRDVKRSDRVAYFKWIKHAGLTSEIEIKAGDDPLGLIHSFIAIPGGTFVVYIGYQGD